MSDNNIILVDFDEAEFDFSANSYKLAVINDLPVDNNLQVKESKKLNATNITHGEFDSKAGTEAGGIFFLPGYASNMRGTKAEAIVEFGRRHNQHVLRFDYSGHGESSGDFIQGSIGLWLQQAAFIYEKFARTPQVVVGSSMGGYLALLLSRKLKGNTDVPPIKAIVLIAPAVDMTEKLIWHGLDQRERDKLVSEGVIYKQTSSYDPLPISLKLIEEGRRHLLMNRPIYSPCPVHILHGVNDMEVPFQNSIDLMGGLIESSVVLTLIKNGDHRLSREADLQNLTTIIGQYI